MSTIFASLNTALSALQTMQKAIQTTGHNVSNAATDGYSRQKVTFVTPPPYTTPVMRGDISAGQIGTGVIADSVKRFRSDFLDDQIHAETWKLKGWEVQQDVFQQVQVSLNEPSDTGLNTYFNSFFTSWQDLAASPDSAAARTYVAETAAEMSSSMREAYRQLSDLRTDLNDRVASQVSTINDLAHQIAGLNKNIAEVQAVGQQPNDLLDQRELALKSLSELVNIGVGHSPNSSVMVSVGGKLLVADYEVSEMAVEQDTNNQLLNKVIWASNGNTVRVSNIPLDNAFSGYSPMAVKDKVFGQLGGTLIARDLIVTHQMDQLDEVANTLIGAVNAVHQTGYGLNGATGGTVTGTTVPNTVSGFAMVTPWSGLTALADGNVSVEIRDNSNVLEFRLVDGSGNPIAINDTGVADPDPANTVTANWQPLSTVAGTAFDTGRGLQVTFDPLVDHALSGVTLTPGDVSSFALSGVMPGLTELPSDTYFTQVRNNAGTWQFQVLDGSGNPAGVYDAAAADGSTTTAWQTIPAGHTFDTGRGLTVNFNPAGPPYAGGLYASSTASNATYTARLTQTGTINNGAATAGVGNFFTGNGAADIALSSYIEDDPRRIATASAPNTLGDGSKALQIYQLSEDLLMNGNTATVYDYYRSTVGELGQNAAHATIMTENHDLLVNHLENRQEEVAGVSVDEETTYLLQYQRTYQAAARIMTTVDEMIDRIINGMGMVGR